jgi:hypothetical protein
MNSSETNSCHRLLFHSRPCRTSVLCAMLAGYRHPKGHYGGGCCYSPSAMSSLSTHRARSGASRLKNPVSPQLLANAPSPPRVSPRALDVMAAVPARPHPGTALRCDSAQQEDATYDDAVLQHVVVVLIVSDWRGLEDERVHDFKGSACEFPPI